MNRYEIEFIRSLKPPREKLLEDGPDTLTNAELLANVFITGNRDEDVLELSNRCIKEYGSRTIAGVRSVDRVQEILGLGKVKACQLVSIFELGRRFFQETNARMPMIYGPEDVFKYYEFMGSLKREEVRAIYLNARQRVIHEELIAIGSVDKVDITPQVVLQPAVELLAKSFIIIHNHPSGETEPSEEDLALTKKMKKAAALLGIKMLDHVIIGKDWNSVG